MIENEINNESENEIENDFNNENISNMIISNENENENEVENIFNEELYTTSSRDNNIKILNTSGLSLLKELEDKWDSIEKRKSVNPGKKNLQNNIIKQEKKNENYLKIKNEILKLKTHFFENIDKLRENYNNKNEEFEQFIFNKISEMEKFKIKSEEINKKIQQREMEKLNENNDNNNYNNNYNDNNYNSYNPNEKTIKHNKKRRDNHLKKNKSFLHDDIYNYDKTKIPLKYRGNLFTCKGITEVEGLVYETPDDSDNNNKIKIYNPVSDTLKDKMKNVYDDILKPTYIPDYILYNINNFESSRENNNVDENNTLKNPKLNNINNNNFNPQNNKNNNNINKSNPINNQTTSLVNYSINSNYASEANINSKTLYSLEKNFDEILNSINPSMNQINKGKNFLGTYLKNENLTEPIKTPKNNTESKEEINPELDKYFEDLSIQAGYKLPNSKKKNNNKNTDNIIEDTYFMKEDIKDKKFLRKMEENVQLLNQLAKVTSGSNNFQERIRNLNNNNNSTYNINEYSKLNKSYIRSHNMSLNSSQNINNSNISFMNNNRVYSKNRFEDILPKMYKSNALKIHKIIQNK